jgi:hypothetical protein
MRSGNRNANESLIFTAGVFWRLAERPQRGSVGAPAPDSEKTTSQKVPKDTAICEIDVRLRFEYSAAMPKKKNSKKFEKNAFLGNLDRLGGKKLMQHGAEESSRGKESRKHSVGGSRKHG